MQTTPARSDRRSVSEFVLDSALARADGMLAQRRHFGLSAQQWEDFLVALDAAPRELPAVADLFNQPSGSTVENLRSTGT